MKFWNCDQRMFCVYGSSSWCMFSSSLQLLLPGEQDTASSHRSHQWAAWPDQVWTEGGSDVLMMVGEEKGVPKLLHLWSQHQGWTTKVSPPPSSWATRGIVRSQLVFQINTSHVLIARKDGMLLTWGASFIRRTVTVWFRLKFDDSTATWQLSNQTVTNWFPFLVGEFPHASAW